MLKLRLALGGAALALLGAGCASDPYYYSGDPYYASSTYPAYYRDRYYYYDRYAHDRYPHPERMHGRITSIEVVRGERGPTTGAGAIVGGVVGGVLGHQIGSGRGNDAATIAGALGGAAVGNELERRHSGDFYRVTVRDPNGGFQSYVMESLGSLRVGDLVRVDNGRIYPVG